MFHIKCTLFRWKFVEEPDQYTEFQWKTICICVTISLYAKQISTNQISNKLPLVAFSSSKSLSGVQLKVQLSMLKYDLSFFENDTPTNDRLHSKNVFRRA